MNRRAFGVGIGLFVLAGLAGSARAYEGTITAVEIAAPVAATPGVPVTVTATVLGMTLDGQKLAVPIPKQDVVWSFRMRPDDADDASDADDADDAAQPAGADVSFTPATSVTDANGVATTQAIVRCDACTVVLIGSADGLTATVIVPVRGAGLPNTATARTRLAAVPPATTAWLAEAAAVAAAVAALIGGLGLLRRRGGRIPR